MCDGVGSQPLVSDFGLVSVLICGHCGSVFEEPQLVEGLIPNHIKDDDYVTNGTV
jgi:hypothetical protein